ncbi:MAG: PAS domain S-box protein [bacterium]
MARNKAILFVDDDPDMLEIAGIVLRKAGYMFIPATSGETGLQLLLARKPHLIILDYMMPQMNGFDFMQTMVSDPKYKLVREIPIIMLTAKSEDEVEREALFNMGLSAFLVKPFGNKELLNVIDNVFILHQLRTKNREQEQQVKRTEYKYQDLIENASDLIFTLNPEGNFSFINRRLPDLTGGEREEWLGRSFFDLIVPADCENAKTNFFKTLQGRSSIFEVRVNHDGGTLYLSTNINPIFEKGQVVGCVGIARNITERKELEQEIIDLQNFNESIIQSIGSGLITLDLERKITSFNNNAEELLGFTLEEVLGKSLESIFPEEECRRLIPNFDDPEQSLLNREMRLTANDGQRVYVGFTVTPRMDNLNHRVGTIISFRDITQIKQMQAEVQRMDRLASMGVLASGIAHEIRNPLAGIKTIAQTLEEEIEPDDSRREYLSRIVRQVNRMDDLLKTIFSYAKPRQPDRKYHRLQEIVQEAVALLDNRLRGQSVQFYENYDPELPLIYVDFYQIQQIFINLVLNALDAMPQGGELRLDARPEITTIRRVDRRGRPFPVKNKQALYARVDLTDTGEGIKPERIANIFNPFYTTKPQGAGLGLSIVYRIMTEHEGDIHVQSELNRGTTFRILLPTEE